MKFSKIIGNPPFNGRDYLYLKILDKMNDMSNNIIWLCPKTWVEQTNPHNRVYSTYLDKFKGNLVSYLDVDSYNFDIEIITKGLGLFYFNKIDNPIDIFDIAWRKYPNSNVAKEISRKTLEYCKENNLYKTHTCIKKVVGTKIVYKDDFNVDNDKWYIGASLVRGTLGFSTWVYIFGKKDIPMKGKVLKNWFNIWTFNTKEEALNFIKFTENPIFLFSVLLEKKNYTNHSAMYKYFPSMPNYLHEWSDKEIMDRLSINFNEMEYILDVLKDYMKYR